MKRSMDIDELRRLVGEGKTRIQLCEHFGLSWSGMGRHLRINDLTTRRTKAEAEKIQRVVDSRSAKRSRPSATALWAANPFGIVGGRND